MPWCYYCRIALGLTFVLSMLYSTVSHSVLKFPQNDNRHESSHPLQLNSTYATKVAAMLHPMPRMHPRFALHLQALPSSLHAQQLQYWPSCLGFIHSIVPAPHGCMVLVPISCPTAVSHALVSHLPVPQLTQSYAKRPKSVHTIFLQQACHAGAMQRGMQGDAPCMQGLHASVPQQRYIPCRMRAIGIRIATLEFVIP